jgi:hypothetical protein
MIIRPIATGLMMALWGYVDYHTYVHQPPPNAAEESILMQTTPRLAPILPSDVERLRQPPPKKKP